MNEVLANSAMASLSNSTLIIVTIVFTLLHIGLLACIIFFKKKLHPMYYMLLIFGTMLYVSPFYNVTCSNTGRWLRLYVVVLTAVIGLLFYRPKQIGFPAKVAIFFAVFMIFNSVRENSAVIAITYKGIFLLCIMSGIMIAHSVRDQTKVLKQLRWFVALMFVYSFFFIHYIGTVSGSGRLLYGAIGPMALGISAGSALVLCAYVGMYDSAKVWKIISVFVCIVLGVVILLTGSRGPALSTACGCFCVALPLFKHPGRLAVVVFLVAVGVVVVANSGIDTSLFARAAGLDTSQGSVTEDVTNGRLAIWYSALAGFRQNPIIGCGILRTGLASGRTFGNPHSIYVQILAENGLVGSAIFIICCILIAYCLFIVYTRGGKKPEIGTLRSLPMACIAVACVYGLTETDSLYGTRFAALLFSIGVGYLDWMYLAIKNPQTARQAVLVRRSSRPPQQLPSENPA